MIRIAFAFVLLSIPSLLQGSVTRFFNGNPADVDPPLQGPAFDLAGGGGGGDAPFQTLVDLVRGCSACDTRVDVVILRSSGGDGYQVWYEEIEGLDSVETFVITDRVSSSDPAIVTAVRNAEVVYFAGGDQCNYIRVFKGTPIQGAVESVVARGGGVGGSSAGLAILGEVVYDACADGSTRSANALKDPWHWDISISTGFFRWQHLYDTFTDTHFAQRDRLGRLLVFRARSLQTAPPGSSLLGIGVDEKTALLVDRNGLGTVHGTGPVYFIRGSAPAEILRPETPLTWCGLQVWTVRAGETFDLANRPVTGGSWMDVNEGVILNKPY